ncbi:MAG: fatty acid desaturase, partial [Paraburkholderia tropica]
MTAPVQPIPPGDPLPHRKILRSWLVSLSGRTTVYPIVLLLIDYAIFAALIALVVFARSLWL